MTEIDAGLAGMETSARSMLAKLAKAETVIRGGGEQLSRDDALAIIGLCHNALDSALGLTKKFQQRETIIRLQGENTMTAIGLALAATGEPN